MGIRDYCEEELDYINNSNGRIATYFDKDIKDRQYEGFSWKQIAEEMISQLPEHVFISFDIDGLDPKLCPHTGTPVQGGFDAQQIFYLFRVLLQKGKRSLDLT